MSGIFGYYKSNNDERIDTSNLLRWNQAYGQDIQKIYEDTNYVLGCCYENISNAPTPQNPILVINQKISVIDALIYNREELLAKCCLQSSFSDEELLFHYIESFGFEALKDVNGDFCGAIYDTTTRILTLFRDHMGIRPLFYCANQEHIIFSTDIRGLTALPEVNATLNEEWIYRKFTNASTLSPDKTEYNNIFCVKPASYIQYTVAENCTHTSSHTYWKLGSQKIRYSSKQEYLSKMRELITDAIQRRFSITSDIVGSELSGGLDSSIISILINQLGKECIYYSWSMNPDFLPIVENDERLIIKDICNQENISCYYCPPELELDQDSIITDNMHKMGLDINNELSPAFRYILPSYTNTYKILQTAQTMQDKGAKIIFSGHGGDEGVSHRCSAFELFFHKEYSYFFKQMWTVTQGQKNRLYKTLKNSLYTIYKSYKESLPHHPSYTITREFLKSSFEQKYSDIKLSGITFSYDPASYILQGGSRNRLDNIALQGAYSGVRYVVPYLDYRVVDFAISIPRHLYLNGKTNRYIFRETFKDIMPLSLYAQQSKQEMSRSNIPESKERLDEFYKSKQQVLNHLNRDYWSQYLNINSIENWLTSTNDTISNDIVKLSPLFQCVVAQNVLDRTREIYEQNTKKEHENADS